MCVCVKYQGFLGAEEKAEQAPAKWKPEGNRDGFWNENQNSPKDLLQWPGSSPHPEVTLSQLG